MNTKIQTALSAIKAFVKKVYSELVMFIAEARLRLKANSGPFWTKIKWLGGILLAVGTAWQLAPHLAHAGSYLIDTGTAIGSIGFFGAKTPPTPEQVQNATK